ncbi:MAG: pre-peptidase C-terminal domain-containing protein, partial [Planctomycetes bacterium]|nr:pre-peptidase C-terminal domain-containing protein [Planctomycetota bacterium]
DRDYWAITISTAPVQLNAWTSARGASPVNDTNLTLYATDGTTQLVFDDSSGAGLKSIISYGVQTNGTYYIAVEGDFSTGDYAFDVTTTPIALLDNCGGVLVPLPRDSEVEPNNMCANANPIAPCTVRTEHLSPNGDLDFYSFVLATSTTVRFETVADSTIPNRRTDTKLWLYDSGCNEIDNDDDGGAGLLSLLETSLTPGQYYIEVADWQRTLGGSYKLEFSSITELVPTGSGTPSNTVVNELQPPQTSICGGSFPAIGVDNEPNSTPAEAQSSGNFIAPCTDTIGTIGMVATGVTDMWCFNVAATSTIIFETIADSTLVNGYTDTKLWLYDSNGTEIDSDDDGGAGLLSLLERVYAPGNYYIECHHWQRAQAGSFRLRMDQLTAATKCIGSNGMQTRVEAREGELAQQGSNVTADITGAAGPGVVFLSFGGAVIPPFGLELSIIGMPNCRLWVNPPVASPNYAAGAGTFEYSYNIGALPVGSQINIQAALIDFGSPRPLQVTLSDTGLSWIVGDETFH